MEQPLEILKKYWGYEGFRPSQEEIIESVITGNDTIALLPTGGGKSICYQIPGLTIEGLCLVVSPLVALMVDQVEQLQKRGLERKMTLPRMLLQKMLMLLKSFLVRAIPYQIIFVRYYSITIIRHVLPQVSGSVT